MPKESIVLNFNREKETKNTVKFEEEERDGQPKVIGSLYVQKYVAKNAASLRVTVEVAL